MSRFALVSASALSDRRLLCKHLRLLLAMSIAQTDASGWCWCNPEKLGKAAGEPRPDGTVEPLPPDEVVRMLGELREWGYVETYTQRSTGRSAYRMILDLPPEGKGV